MIEKPEFFRLVVGLHLLIGFLNGGWLFVYFQRLWKQEHYQFFPVAMLVFCYVLFVRLERGVLRESIFGTISSAILLLLSSLLFTVTLFTNTVLTPTIGVWVTIASLLICLQDKETKKSLFPTWLLLLPLIRIPLNLDIEVITQLQFFSSAFASNVLDFLAVSNYSPGTIIQIASQDAETGIKRFDVERACSGVQSLFTLLFCTLTVAVWSRRSIVAGAALVFSGIFWSITMNGMRIVICVAFYHWFNFDVYSGIKHEILGYLMLFAAVVLIASTDAVFGFLLGPIDLTSRESNYFASLWNRLVAGVEMVKRRRTRSVPFSSKTKKICRIITLAVLSGACITSFFAFVASLALLSNRNDAEIGDLRLLANDLPKQLFGETKSVSWAIEVDGFENTERNSNSIYGRFSSSWPYSGRLKKRNLVSLDYPFNGWHELSICYRANGWEIERQILVDPSWPYVELEMTNNAGEFGYCVFSSFDFRGELMRSNFDRGGSILERIRARVNKAENRTTFQVQCFVQSSDPFTEEEIKDIHQLHKTTRELLRTKVLEKLKNRDE